MAFNLYQGLKVIDLAQGVAGPFCARLFADLGADVVKVEPPEGDPARRLGPFPNDTPDAECGGLFLALNANKRGVTLNLETASGRELLRQVAAGADMLVESFAPGCLAELGLGYSILSAANPGLVMVSVTPFGQTGPWANWQANNLILSNLSGHAREHPGAVADLERYPPLQLAARQAEFVAGVNAAAAASIALNGRRVTGIGCHLDVSALEALALVPQTALAEQMLSRPAKSRWQGEASRQSLLALLPCDDGVVAISPRQQDQWERFTELMGQPDWAADARFATVRSRLENWAALEPLLAAWTSRRSKEEVYRLAQASRIPSFPLNTAADLFQSAQFRAREFFIEVEHPAAGRQTYPGWPIKLASGRNVELAPAPLLGQHNQAVLGQAGLGLTPEQLATLRSLNAI